MERPRWQAAERHTDMRLIPWKPILRVSDVTPGSGTYCMYKLRSPPSPQMSQVPQSDPTVLVGIGAAYRNNQACGDLAAKVQRGGTGCEQREGVIA